MSESFDDPRVYGSIVGGHDADDLLIGMIRYWGPSYLAAIARRAGEDVNEFKMFRSMRVSHELEKMPEDQTPGLILVNQGLADSPMKQGTAKPGKTYYATWSYQFGCLLSARGKKINAQPRAIRLAKMYCLAIRLLIIQKRDDDDFRAATGLPTGHDEWVLGMTDWMDEGYDGVESEDDRTICLAHTDFQINVPDAATWAAGPLVPEIAPAQEEPLWPIVTSADDIHIEIVKEETE